ncbi:MAG: hypothetical protein IKK67_06140 [Bacteroidaceae bacterium]|nr:hypothetical protein [Bacteroidaceae bacterium]
MKKNVFIIILSICIHACSDNKCNTISTISLDSIPTIEGNFLVHQIEDTLLYPRAINIFNKYIVITEPQQTKGIYTFWDINSFKFLFSAGNIGGGPNEFINPKAYYDYFAHTDSSFFILDSNIEKEVVIRGQELFITKRNPIIAPTSVNQMVRVGDDFYIMSGMTNGQKGEHISCVNGEYTFWGEYPYQEAKKEKRFIRNFKYTAGFEGNNVILDFYRNMNLVRIYDVSGTLIKEIFIDDNTDRNIENIEKNINRPFFCDIKNNREYIAVMYNKGKGQGYSQSQSKELQLWDWDGCLLKRIVFEHPFDCYTISENNTIYAINSNEPNTIYTYNIKL